MFQHSSDATQRNNLGRNIGDGILGTGIDILIKLLKNRLTKMIEQMPKDGAISESVAIDLSSFLIELLRHLFGPAHHCR